MRMVEKRRRRTFVSPSDVKPNGPPTPAPHLELEGHADLPHALRTNLTIGQA